MIFLMASTICAHTWGRIKIKNSKRKNEKKERENVSITWAQFVKKYCACCVRIKKKKKKEKKRKKKMTIKMSLQYLCAWKCVWVCAVIARLRKSVCDCTQLHERITHCSFPRVWQVRVCRVRECFYAFCMCAFVYMNRRHKTTHTLTHIYIHT